MQLCELQTVCQSKRRQQRSEFDYRLWRCNNPDHDPDQQWELCQNLACMWVASRVSTDCNNRDTFAWLRDESCLQVYWSALSQVPQRDATVVLRFTFRSTRLDWLLRWHCDPPAEIYRRLCQEIKLREKCPVIYYSTYEGALSHCLRVGFI